MSFSAFTRIWFGLGRLKRATSANVAIIFAFTLPVVVGAAGFGVETSYWYYSSLKLQAVADAAAYAGALEKISGSDTPTIVSAATLSATSNGFATPGTIDVFTPPSSGPNVANKAVEVIVHQNLDRYFTAIFNQGPVPNRQERWLSLRTLQKPVYWRSIHQRRRRRSFPAAQMSN